MPHRRSPFPIRGAIEGFYGTYYTAPERDDLIRFLGKHGFNFYLYGPKNDRQHRMRWWEPYPQRILDDFADSIRIAHTSKVEFCYAISFGVPVDYGSPEQFEQVQRKFESFFALGCRSFAALLDDMPTYFSHEPNRRRFRSPAHAHSDFCNRLRDWLVSLDPACRFVMCPTDYFGKPPFSAYLRELGRLLHAEIPIAYTGRVISAPTITLEDVRAFEQAVGRPPLIWDNYPANDLQMRPELHIGPLEGRDPRLAEATSGYLANLMNQAEASKIPLLTTSEYLRHPGTYDAWAAWERALLAIGGEDAYGPLHRFAENSLGSPLRAEEAPRMDNLVSGVLDAVRSGQSALDAPAVGELSRYLDELDESIYYLKNRLQNLALRYNLIPWIEALDEKVWMTKFSLSVLRGLEDGSDVRGPVRRLRETVTDAWRNPKRVGGALTFELADLALERARRTTRTGKRKAKAEEEVPFAGARNLEVHGYSSEGH